MNEERRRLLLATATLGAAGLVPQLAVADEGKDEKPEEEVGALEDLMREHGVLNRVLLVYEEGLRRLHAKEEVPPELFLHTAALVRQFVEDYHERLEERFLFPEFERRNRLVDLVKVLRRQHEAGRAVTDIILEHGKPERFRQAESREKVVTATRAFVHMYRPHEAREDTVLFPALHRLVPGKRLAELGEQFEKEEDRLFGEGGFQKTVEKVAELEKQLGIHDLDQFTPKLPLR
jgi:hemerythrin-like domain-containing protein